MIKQCRRDKDVTYYKIQDAHSTNAQYPVIFGEKPCSFDLALSITTRLVLNSDIKF